MLGLVDYPSSDEEDPVAVQPAAVSSKSTSTSTASSSSLPSKKRERQGPVKIMLDLPPVKSASSATSASTLAGVAEQEPAKKKPKFNLSGNGGLAGLLPAPKRSAPVASTPTASTSASTSTLPGEEQASTSLIPHKVAGAKKPAAVLAATEPATDFFSLSSAPAIPSAAAASTQQPKASTSKLPSLSSVSSAPTLADPVKQNYYATLPPATPNDPYPGFHCLPSGQWAPNRPIEWQDWAEQNGWAAPATSTSSEPMTAETSTGAAPKGFEPHKLNSLTDAGAKQDKDGKEQPSVPAKMSYVPEDEDGDPEAKERRLAELKKYQGKNARGKNQLSSLLSRALQNREELEERIAASKANKRAGGAKYGEQSFPHLLRFCARWLMWV